MMREGEPAGKINRSRQEVNRSEKRLEERKDEHLVANVSRMTKEAEERERRLRGHLQQLRSLQEQTLGTLDPRIDEIMETRSQAIMDRLDGLLGNRSGSRNRGAHSEEATREPRVNFNKHPNTRTTYGSTRGRGNSSSNVTGKNRPRGPTNTRGSSTGRRPTSSERPMRDSIATGRGDSASWNHSIQEKDRRETDNNDQAGHSRDATAVATAIETLNSSLENFLTRLSRTSERSEKPRRVFKKPRYYKNESDGCIDTWIEVMKMHFEEEDLTERQECLAVTSNLEGTALNCVMAIKQYQPDTAEKIFEILLNHFGSGARGTATEI